MSRKGALEMAAMGARRQSWGISIWPIFIVEPGSGPGYPIYTGRRIDVPAAELESYNLLPGGSLTVKQQ